MSYKVLANDGLGENAIELLKINGFEVYTDKVDQKVLATEINNRNIEILLVRSATKVYKDIIEKCPNLKIIGRAGVGLDNIDVEFAKQKGIKVINTPLASSISVAELVFAHIFSISRNLHDSNRKMPLEGDKSFSALKKWYSKGIELRGKTIGIYGFGNIGQNVAKIAIGLGMNVVPYDIEHKKVIMTLDVHKEINAKGKIEVTIETQPIEVLFNKSDIVTLHVSMPNGGSPIIDYDWFNKLKKHVIFVNASRGSVVDEDGLLKAVNEGKVIGAGLDVFANEPTPNIRLLMDARFSLTPHIGGSTAEAQERIGYELVSLIINLTK